MDKKEIARIEQKKFGKGKQAFVLREDGTLLVTLSKGGNLQHFSITLTGWESEPVHEKNVARFSRFLLKVIVVLIILSLLGMAFMPIKDLPGMLCMFIVFSFMGFMILSEYLQRSYDILLFRNQLTGGQLMLYNNIPNEKEFSSFVAALKTVMKKFPYVMPEHTNTAVADLREFARLRDDGVLTNEEFEEAKRKLLSTINTPSNMGFRP